jgi:hypothetical protein
MESVHFVDLCGLGGGDAITLEKNHDVAHGLLFQPREPYPPRPFRPNTRDFLQAPRILINDLQGFLPKEIDNALREFRTDPLDESRPKILLQTRDVRGKHGFVFRHLELLSKLGMVDPLPLNFQCLTALNRGQIPHNGDDLSLPVQKDLSNGVMILFVRVENFLE